MTAQDWRWMTILLTAGLLIAAAGIVAMAFTSPSKQCYPPKHWVEHCSKGCIWECR